MSTPHRATAEQWQKIEEFVKDCGYDSCLLELRARIELLEATQHAHDGRIDALETAHEGAAMDELRAASAEARPGGLVERVAEAMQPGTFDWSAYEDEARAAIREVAAALLEWHDSDQVVHTAWEAAKWLQQEADRG